MPVDVKTRLVSRRGGKMGSGARCSRSRNAPSATTVAAPRPITCSRSPRVGGAAEGHHQHQSRKGGGQQAGAQVVDAVVDSARTAGPSSDAEGKVRVRTAMARMPSGRLM